ncbi:MAG: outer membrane lipoprotein carrier protein LolA [Gemmatimonadota bacterium]|nr:outer membrane lipoprotein carrier protein LolA [Gemmatimonadota bacterium]
MKYISWVAVFCLSAWPLYAQEAERVLATAETTYRSLATIEAQFTQTIENPMLGEPEITTGTLYLEKPDRFAMKFADPQGDRIVADGSWLWLYTPSTTPNQVIRQPVPERGAATPNLFGQFVDRPLERYTARYVGAGTVNGMEIERVLLNPRTGDAGFRRAEISVSQDGMMRRIIIVEDSGQVRTLVFDSIAVNIAIAERELSFTVPNGTRIVTP